MEEVIITGMGLITSLGQNVEDVFHKIIQGETGIAHLEAWDISRYKTQLAAEIKTDLPINTHKSKLMTVLDRGHQLLLGAVREALEKAELLDQTGQYKIGIVIGTSLAGMKAMQIYDSELNNGKRGDINYLIGQPLHVCADLISKEFNLTGPRMVISTACTASTIAIGTALAMLRNQKADIVIAAGCDPLSSISYTGFSCMRNMSATPCSPYSTNEGLTLGEGSGAIILEPVNTAKARKIKGKIYITDYMFSADAYHATSPDPKGGGHTYLIQELLKRANLRSDKIDYINMHGTGTNGNDIAESKVIRQLFYRDNHRVPVSSIKGAIGHTLGAAGIVESVVTIKSLEKNILPPTTNFTQAREGCTLDYVPNRMRKTTLNTALVQNFAFGGNNAAIIFTKNKSVSQNHRLTRRVVITGSGAITPLGCSFDEIITNIDAQKTAISDIFSENYRRYFKAAVLKDFNPRLYVKADFRRMDRFSQLLVASAALTLMNSGLNIKNNPQSNIGYIVGTMSGHVESNLKFHREILNNHPDNIDPFIFPNTVTNAGAGQAAIVNRLKGCNLAVSVGQASGLAAINLAYDFIRDGLQPAIIAGGADELSEYLLYNYYRAGLVRSNAAKKIINRDKLELNEGAVFFMLEDYNHAIARGAKIYAEIIDYQSICNTSLDSTDNAYLNNAFTNMSTLLSHNEHGNDHKNNIDIYTSGLNVRKIQEQEKLAIQKLALPQSEIYRTDPYIGISGLTSALNFGLGCFRSEKCSIINAASIGGTFYSTLVNRLKDGNRE